MVFENLTLFEVNLENSRFSASRGDESEEVETESYESESESESESGGGRSKALPLGLLLVLVIGGLAFRRYRSGGDGGEEVGTGDEGITIEQAADQ